MRGTSKTKFLKGTNTPKHSGNYSYINSDEYRFHYQQMQYPISVINGRLILGGNTPLDKVMPEQLCWLMMNDPNFESYRETGTHTYGAKKYDCERTIRRSIIGERSGMHKFYMNICINTRGDFKYNFPEY